MYNRDDDFVKMLNDGNPNHREKLNRHRTQANSK